MSKSFIEKMAVLYQAVPSPILVSVRIAQACVESSYGQSDLAREANNYAGIKATAPWKGDTYTKVSPEFLKGVWTKEQSTFRKYPSVEAFVKDHSAFFTSTEVRKRAYAKAIEATTYQGQCAGLTGVYATDPRYGRKLIDVIETYNLTQFDSKEGNQMREFKQYITQVNMGGQIGKVEYLVLHFVGAAGQALANAKFFYSVDRKSSAHLFIDPKETYQVVPFDRVAWHVGDGRGRYGITNQNSIGVELCQDVTTGKDVWNWDFHPDTRQEAIRVFAYLMKKFNVPIERVVRHYDASRKSCPGNWMANDWAKWKLWKKDLETYVKTGKLVNSQKGEVAPVTKPVVEIPKYTSPDKQFTKLEVGQEVTIRQGQTFWYDPNNPTKGIVPSKNFGGKKDKIKKVLDVSVGYSKRAYLLEGLVSWILEQDLVEARQDWDKKVVEKETTIQDDYTLVIDGKKYRVVEDK
ncbi:TPA: glucosaminidase domain-containing protein [Streptococcus suis]